MAVMILALADGATAMSDMAMLRGLKSLFGPVASTATLWRTFNRIGPAELRDLTAADAQARAVAWGLEPSRSRIVVDIDATIVTCRSDKQDAAGTWKRSFGFHPLVAMDIERREVLAQMVRPGNAGSNTAADHVQVLAAAIDALPEAERAGHGFDDDPEAVGCEIVIRADASGATHWLAEEATDRNCRFSLGYAIDDRVRLAVEASMALDADTTTRAKRCWTPAIEADGEPRDGAEVADLTDFIDLSSWPEGTRLIVRRERAHPGAQLSLFDDIEGRRHTAFITNQAGDPEVLELAHRQRGAAEDVIRDLKACGYNNWPSEDIVNNQAWALCSTMAFNLLSRASASPCWAATAPPPPRPSATGSSTSPAGSPPPAIGSTSTATGPGPPPSSTASTTPKPSPTATQRDPRRPAPPARTKNRGQTGRPSVGSAQLLSIRSPGGQARPLQKAIGGLKPFERQALQSG